jgi:hypothetical protein
MRERAAAADSAPSAAASWYAAEEVAIALTDGEVATEVQANKDAPHIASWHPAVALAVADLLDAFADRADAIASTIGSERVGQSIVANSVTGYARAHAVATAYLGADA